MIKAQGHLENRGSVVEGKGVDFESVHDIFRVDIIDWLRQSSCMYYRRPVIGTPTLKFLDDNPPSPAVF